MDQIKENLKLLEVAEHKAIVINQCKSESFGYAYDVKKYRG